MTENIQYQNIETLAQDILIQQAQLDSKKEENQELLDQVTTPETNKVWLRLENISFRNFIIVNAELLGRLKETLGELKKEEVTQDQVTTVYHLILVITNQAKYKEDLLRPLIEEKDLEGAQLCQGNQIKVCQLRTGKKRKGFNNCQKLRSLQQKKNHLKIKKLWVQHLLKNERGNNYIRFVSIFCLFFL